jgi:NAD(P)H-hydrate epimerase
MNALTREQVREVDRRAIQEYGVPGIVLMENAGRGAAAAILERLDDPAASRVAIACGSGNNGGDGFVIARHLVNRGVPVTLLMQQSDPAALPPDARTNHDIAARMDIPRYPLCDPSGRLDEQRVRAVLAGARLIVDALLGTGFSGAVRPPLDRLIDLINAARAQRVAIDVPSGLDCDTGAAAGPAVRADLTVTFVAPKIGFGTPQAREYVGQVMVVDIGAPRGAID